MKRLHLCACVFLTGSSLSSVAGAQGSWSEVDTLSTEPRHMILLPPVLPNYPEGLVLYARGDHNNNDVWIWNPDGYDNAYQADGPGFLFHCAGHSFLDNGTMLIVGGTQDLGDPQQGAPINCGEKQVAIYNPFTDTMQDLGDMPAGRWYPTCITDAYGDVYFFGGYEHQNSIQDPCPQHMNRRVDRFVRLISPSLSTPISDMGFNPPLYPRMHYISDETIVAVAPGQQSVIYDIGNPGMSAGHVTELQNSRGSACSVLLPIDLRDAVPAERILLIGGHTNDEEDPTATCEILKASDPTADWVDTDTLNSARAHANATILSNGDIFLSGGGESGKYGCPIYTPERFEFDLGTQTGDWTEISAVHSYPRMYHAVALLLAEGAVMTAGQDVNSNCSGNIQNGGAKVEIYYPPYCSDVDRPTITSFPSAAIERDGPGFVVEFDIDENRSLDYVALISLSAVSHSVNMTQRYLILDHTPDANDPESKATIEPPPFLYAPPGPYMLVVVDNTRSASRAEFVYVE